MSQPTHKIRPHAADKWQHVTDQELATIKKQVGERTFASSYAVEKLAEKPAALETTEAPKKGQPAAGAGEAK
jgi:hypothetical protein